MDITKHCLVRAAATAHPEAGGNAAVDKDAWLYRGFIRLPDLDQGKGYQKYKGDHKQRDNTPLTPLDAVSFTSPTQELKVLCKKNQA